MALVDHAQTQPSRIEATVANGVRIVSLVVLASIVIALIAFVIMRWNDPEIRKIAADHLRATVGLPIAGVFALLIIAVFRTTSGQIEFSGLGFTFKGASGPIVMWVLCFLAIAGSLRMLW